MRCNIVPVSHLICMPYLVFVFVLRICMEKYELVSVPFLDVLFANSRLRK